MTETVPEISAEPTGRGQPQDHDHAEHGRNSRCIVAREPGLMYDFALLLFSTTWDHSRPAEDAVSA
jgi:hypothetical protein